MQNWLARFSFSFFIIAAVLLWQGYKLSQTAQTGDHWRLTLYFLGAGACAALGVAGVKARHRDAD